MCTQRVDGIIATSAVTKIRSKEIPTRIGGNMINRKTVVINVITAGKK